MKNIFYVLLLSVLFSSCFTTNEIRETPLTESNSPFVILRNGEKIDNIQESQWRSYKKTGHLNLGDRVISPENVLWVKEAGALWLINEGFPYKCKIDGKVSIFIGSRGIANSNGIAIYAPKYFMLLKDETVLNKEVNYENLKKAMADDPQSLEKIEKIHTRLANRDLITSQLKVVREYNSK